MSSTADAAAPRVPRQVRTNMSPAFPGSACTTASRALSTAAMEHARLWTGIPTTAAPAGTFVEARLRTATMDGAADASRVWRIAAATALTFLKTPATAARAAWYAVCTKTARAVCANRTILRLRDRESPTPVSRQLSYRRKASIMSHPWDEFSKSLAESVPRRGARASPSPLSPPRERGRG